MAEDRQPATVVEGATTGDVEDEVGPTAKSAEDRKAAAALSKLDTHGDDDEGQAGKHVDHEAVSRAMDRLGGGRAGGDAARKADEERREVRKVKVDPADVALLVDELDLSKVKATELLKSHDGDAVKAMRAFIAVK